MGDNIVGIISIMPAVIVFIGLGIYSLKRKTPMHFWAGTVVKAEEIKDIKAYNRANGIMWIVYGLSYLLVIPMAVLIGDTAYMIIGIQATLGLVILIICYNCIYKKYKTNIPIKKDSSNRKYEKCEKIVFAFILLVCFIPCLILVTVDVTGGHELTISDNTIRISMNSFNTEDIKDIELLEDINIKRKINGSSTFIYSRGLYKINDETEVSRVYLYKNSKPYIRIELKDSSIIYYNEKEGNDTEKTYNKLLEYIK